MVLLGGKPHLLSLSLVRDIILINGVLSLGDKTSFIRVLSLVRDKFIINVVLSLGDNNPVFGVLLLED